MNWNLSLGVSLAQFRLPKLWPLGGLAVLSPRSGNHKICGELERRVTLQKLKKFQLSLKDSTATDQKIWKYRLTLLTPQTLIGWAMAHCCCEEPWVCLGTGDMHLRYLKVPPQGVCPRISKESKPQTLREPQGSLRAAEMSLKCQWKPSL